MSSSLGQRIRDLRLKKGITQIDLSKDLCTPSMISQIESDRARPSYKILFAIADRLDVPLEKLLSDVDLNMEYVSSYKMARAMVAGKEYSSAIPLFLELLDAPRSQISSAEIFYELGECYLYTDQLEEAEKMFQKVLEFSMLRMDHQMLALVYKNIGLLEYRRNQFILAAYEWQKALEEAEKMEEQDAYIKANLNHNLGHVHVKMGKVSQALEYYDQASQLYGGNLLEMGKVYMELAQSYKKLSHFEKAAEYSDRALSIFEGMENIMATLRLQVSQAAIMVETGRYEEAESLLQTVITKYREYGKKEEEGIALVEFAKLRARQGEYERVEELCRQARSMLPEMHLYQAVIHRLLGSVAVAQKQNEEALRKLQQAADCFKMLHDWKEWDETMYQIAQLHQAENDFARAVHVLEIMRSFTRKSMQERGMAL